MGAPTEIYHSGKQRLVNAKDFVAKVNDTFDDDGKPYKQYYVEFTVVGENTEYQDFMLSADFTRYNPEIPVEIWAGDHRGVTR